MNELIFLFLTFFLLKQPVQATETNPNTTIDNNKVEDLTNKLKEIVKDTSTEENVKDENPKSFFGTITQVTNNSLTLDSNNQSKNIQLSDETAFVNSKRQKSKISDFKVGDTILAMGYLNTDNSLDCRRIVATSSESVENDNQIVTGQIVDVSQSQSSFFAFTPFQNKDTQYQIKIDSKTEINDNNQKKLKSSDTIVKGKKMIIIMRPDTDNNQTFYATRIISLENNSPSLTPTSQP